MITDAQPANLGWFGICVLAGWASLTTTWRQTLVLFAFLLLVLAAQWLQQTHEPGWGAWAFGTVLTVVAGAFSRKQWQLVDELREAQAGLAEKTRTEERNRLAGEMHDVIGHALTVSLLHVSSARLALEDDPDLARESLDEAERLSRTSLEEVRTAVGLMRGEQAGGVTPLPDGTDLEELVESFRRAAMSVDLVVDGDLAELGPSKGLAVYRIVQESLTNATRHACGSAASVRVATDRATTTISVVNEVDHLHGEPAEGSGLLAMRERAEALGGSLSAGPASGPATGPAAGGAAGSGWRVEAWLPA